jgi:hypothetical protein
MPAQNLILSPHEKLLAFVLLGYEISVPVGTLRARACGNFIWFTPQQDGGFSFDRRSHLPPLSDVSPGTRPRLAKSQTEMPKFQIENCWARPLLPDIAMAYNYLGLILQGLEQIEPAIDA